METIELIEDRSRQLLQKIDDVTTELYALGGAEERLSLMDALQTLINHKKAINDYVAADVLIWAYNQLEAVN